MATKVAVNTDGLQKQLDAARRRLASQEEALKSAQDGLASAISLKMKATENAIRNQLPRLQRTLQLTRDVITELESVIGELPLK